MLFDESTEAPISASEMNELTIERHFVIVFPSISLYST